ncbi:heavy metal-binding domain-containing protein [Kutzneria sp. 744]|uniref:heavy metal-binding domain-containing protein n=1 Tax=Kutzneria sp. (strain 744) TaxID=345341 RepID=UPI0003EECF7B|nr:heavy metal-binding domain-containing protein [Kutzneria sp. 744]EWM16255.1 vegetative cell wall protein gp1 [Kutzneria sp. 744]
MHGLPPAAVERLNRAKRSGVRTSLLSAPSAAGIKAVGLEPVGEVMGCVVLNTVSRYQTYAPGYGYNASSFARPYLQALDTGYNTALERLRAEARALGADGVVDIRLSLSSLGQAEEFLAMGTAVRAQSTTRPKALFTTDLSGSDVAKLMLAGWAPVQVEWAGAANAVYTGVATQAQTALYAGNIEVGSYTRLINHVRADARTRFHDMVRKAGAEGGIVNRMSLSTWEPGEQIVAALASVYGTAIAKFHRGAAAPARTLTVMPLRRQGE